MTKPERRCENCVGMLNIDMCTDCPLNQIDTSNAVDEPDEIPWSMWALLVIVISILIAVITGAFKS